MTMRSVIRRWSMAVAFAATTLVTGAAFAQVTPQQINAWRTLVRTTGSPHNAQRAMSQAAASRSASTRLYSSWQAASARANRPGAARTSTVRSSGVLRRR